MGDERRTVDGVEYSVILEQDDGGGGYEWDHAALVRRIADGQLVLVTESGCSCNGPWDSPDLEPVDTWQAAVEKLQTDRPYFFNEDDVARFAERLMELRPASSRQAARPTPDRG